MAGDDGTGELRINDLITRAEAVKVFTRAAEHEIEVITNCLRNYFPDVERGGWYHRYVQNLQERDIVHGYDDGFYRPDKNINQAELFKIAAITFGYTNKAAQEADTLEWHEHYRQALLSETVMPGWLLKYEPDQPVTRGDLFALISKILLSKDGLR